LKLKIDFEKIKLETYCDGSEEASQYKSVFGQASPLAIARKSLQPK
jgi:hypothetical protein